MFWKELPGFGDQLFTVFRAFRIDDAALHGTFDLAHCAFVESHALGAPGRVDDAHCQLLVLGDRSCGADFVAGTTVYTFLGNIQTHPKTIGRIR